jgi:hypothetical protein
LLKLEKDGEWGEGGGVHFEVMEIFCPYINSLPARSVLKRFIYFSQVVPASNKNKKSRPNFSAGTGLGTISSDHCKIK